MKVTYLYHSGFAIEDEQALYVFDYYKGELPVIAKEKQMYVFVSHRHKDHYNSEIFDWEKEHPNILYILSDDVEAESAPNRIFVKPEQKIRTGELKVETLRSTDEGVAFLVTCKDKRIYHAGDLNWWHWAGEPAADNLAARRDFFHELSRFSERQVDVAFFPVDARQQAAREWGVMAYLERVEPKLLVAMHAFGKRWLPSYEFLWHYPEQKLWIPEKDGDVKETES